VVDRTVLWAAVDDALHGRLIDPLPELGPVEHLLAAVACLMKPRFVGDRWPILDPGDTWADLLPIHRPDTFTPVEVLLYALAGHLRLAGRVPNPTPGLLALLLDTSWDDAESIVEGDYLSRASAPLLPPGDTSFPSELKILDRTCAATNLERVWQATRRYRDGDTRFVAEVCARFHYDSSDNQLDEKIFADLAQIASTYDLLTREDIEVLVVRWW
jgi:hypothetical protein